MSARTSAPAAFPKGALEATLSHSFDLWGAYFRICLALPGLLIALTVLAGERWVLLLLLAYLAVAALVPAMLRSARVGPLMNGVRPVLVLMDVALVSALNYGWGTQVSPAAFMYVAVVVGWTLVPQRGMGLLSLLSVLVSVAGLLLAESSGWAPIAPLALPDSSVMRAPGGPALYFMLFAAALTAAHVLVSLVVTKLSEHVHAVAELRAENEAREREVAWAHAREESERLEALGRLAGGIAHDFNNLLTALLGFAELAQQRLRSAPNDAEGALKELTSAAERAATLTTQLLDFASRRSTQPKLLELRAEVERSARMLRRVLGTQVELRVSLGESACACTIDPSGLERVLVNLAVNARDAMPSGGTLAIELERAHDGSAAILLVRDTGQGIQSQDLGRIFEPFFTTKEKGRGVGLGLPSVYGIVKQSGGEIEVESEPGVGTTFRIRLPLARERPSQDVVLGDPPAPRGESRVLVVDDDATVRAVVRAHLEDFGYSVLEACGGGDALAVLEREDIELLLSDVAMPGMSGLELARAVRTRQPELAILLISGFSDADIRETDELPTGARFLSKPFSAERLLREVAQTIASSRLTTAAAEARSPH